MDKHDEIPKLIETSIDFKGLYVSVFANSMDLLRSGKIEQMNVGPNTKLIIMTHSAQITADLFHAIDEEENYKHDDDISRALKIFLKSIRYVVHQHISDVEQKMDYTEVKFGNQSHVIHLRDAVVTPFSNPSHTFTYKYLSIFSDQIVGISFGEPQHG